MIRSRPDVLLPPEALNLARISSVLRDALDKTPPGGTLHREATATVRADKLVSEVAIFNARAHRRALAALHATTVAALATISPASGFSGNVSARKLPAWDGVTDDPPLKAPGSAKEPSMAAASEVSKHVDSRTGSYDLAGGLDEVAFALDSARAALSLGGAVPADDTVAAEAVRRLSSPSPRALLVPFCCDWNGLNDQFAIGTQVPHVIRMFKGKIVRVASTDLVHFFFSGCLQAAMSDYARRYFTWHQQHPAMARARAATSIAKAKLSSNNAGNAGCVGDSDFHTLVNAQSRLSHTLVLRFVFE